MWNLRIGLVLSHGDLALQSDRFLVVGVNRYRTGGILSRFATIAAVKEYPAQQNVSIDQLRIPEDGSLERGYRSLLITQTLIDASAQ